MKNYHFNLIDTTYPINEARDVIFSLMYEKIKFLNAQILRMNDRYGIDGAHLIERVRKLKEERAALKNTLNSLTEDENMVEIKCAVKIKIKKDHVSKEKLTI